MSAQALLVGFGQVLVGWAMVVPPAWQGRPLWIVRGWRMHAVALLASFGCGLVSLVACGYLGFVGVVSLPQTCADVAPRRCCVPPLPVPRFCFEPSLWSARSRLSGTSGR